MDRVCLLRIQARVTELPVHRYTGVPASLLTLSNNAALVLRSPAHAPHALRQVHGTLDTHRDRDIGPQSPPTQSPPVTMYTGIQIAPSGTSEMALFCLTFVSAKPRQPGRVAPPVDLATRIPINMHPCCLVFPRITDAANYRSPGIHAPLDLSPSVHGRLLQHSPAVLHMVPVILVRLFTCFYVC